MCSSREGGFSLLEVVIFIVVLGIGIAGMAVLYNQVTLASVDPLVRKQALAIANSLMEEIQLRAFTYCDPDDPLVFGHGSGDCGTPEDGPKASALRRSAVRQCQRLPRLPVAEHRRCKQQRRRWAGRLQRERHCRKRGRRLPRGDSG
jgi:type II secretory pathway pseudopilin PulG